MARNDATDFNISDEVTDEDTERDESEVLAGDEDEEREEDEDRGDVVAPGQGEEADPDAAGATTTEEEAEPEEEIDSELLQELAGKPGMVPKARLDEVLAQNRQLLEALSAVAGTGKTAAAPAPAAEEPPAFDLKAKIKEKNAALLEGDEDKALEIDMEIEDYRLAEATRRAETSAISKIEARSVKTRTEAVVADAFDKYTFLNDGSEDFKPEALEEVMMYRDHFFKKGHPLDVALQKAVDKVCPQYASTDEGEAEGKKPDPTKRDPKVVIRNAKAAKGQPPELGKAGTANRETIDTSKLDLEGMDDEAFDALPAAVKAQLRGDASV